MYELSEKHRKIRSLQAKTKPRKANGHFRKTRQEEAGLIIMTCLPTNRQYVTKSLNAWRQVNVIKCRMRKMTLPTQAVNDDIAKYGVGKFRVGVGETIRRMAEETDEKYEARLNTLYAEYIKDKSNLYETYYMPMRAVPLYERKNLDQLGKTRGKQNLDIDKCSCVYVLTCKKNDMHYVGVSGNFFRQWRRMLSELNRDDFYNQALQGDWNEHGFYSFTCEFVRVARPDLRRAKQTVQGRFDNLYSDKRSGRA